MHTVYIIFRLSRFLSIVLNVNTTFDIHFRQLSISAEIQSSFGYARTLTVIQRQPPYI